MCTSSNIPAFKKNSTVIFRVMHVHYRAFLVAQLVKNPPAMRETLVRSLGWEDPLEKGKATHSSIRAWRIPWTVQSSPWGCKETDTTEWLSLSLFSSIDNLQSWDDPTSPGISEGWVGRSRLSPQVYKNKKLSMHVLSIQILFHL